jgi:Cu(I)/Ag(I) efflux system membrane fusion protein
MDMELVPRYPDDADAGSAGLRIDPRLAQNLGIRLATVRRQAISRAIDAPGVIEFNGRNIAVVQARAGGFVSRVYPAISSVRALRSWIC